MNRKPYPSDLTDEQWDIRFPLLPPAKPGGRPQSVDLREVVNGILCVLRAGCPWRMAPHDLPPWQTLYKYFRRWSVDGTWNGAMKRSGPWSGKPKTEIPLPARPSSTARA